MPTDLSAHHLLLMNLLKALFESKCTANVQTRRRRAVKPAEMQEAYYSTEPDGTKRFFSIQIAKSSSIPQDTFTDSRGWEYAMSYKYQFAVIIMLGFSDEANSEDEVVALADTLAESIESETFRNAVHDAADCHIYPVSVNSYAPIQIGENNFVSSASLMLTFEKHVVDVEA